MAKVDLTDLANLSNQQASVVKINQNNARIEAAIENTLSRDGSSPNEMNANLDMNNYRIYNLPEPIGPTEPVRRDDITEVLDLADQFEEAIEATQDAVDAYASMQALYLGQKTSLPLVDNLGNPLQEGALVYLSDQPDPADDGLYVWDNGAWGSQVGIIPPSNDRVDFPTKAAAVAATIPSGVTALRLAGYTSAGDLGGALYRKVVSEPSHAGKFQTVDGAWWELSESTVNPKMFGAAGDGSTNDTTAIRNTVAYGAPEVDGLKKWYKVVADNTVGPAGSNSVVVLKSNTVYKNLRLDFSTSPNNSYCLVATGTEASGVACSSGLAKGARSITMSSVAGLAVNDWLRLRTSSQYWGNEAGATELRGELKRISGIAGSDVTFGDGSYDTYTSSNLNYHKLSLLENITIMDCEFLGGGDSVIHLGHRFDYIQNLVYTRNHSKLISYYHIDARGLVNSFFTNNYFEAAKDDQSLGLNYGIVLSGACQDVVMSGNVFRLFRHAITLGGNDGVNRRNVVTSNTMWECIESGVDTHPSADMTTISNNIIHGRTGTGSNRDGIMLQGANHTVTGNVVDGFTGAGIIAQLMAAAVEDLNTISGNRISSNEADVWGIFIENFKSTYSVGAVVINGNVIEVSAGLSNGILVQSVQGSGSLRNLAISGNTIYATRNGILMSTSSGFIENIAISGNVIRSTDTTNYYGIRGSGSGLGYVAVTGNVVQGGWAGMDIDSGFGTVVGGTGQNNFYGYGAGGAIA